MPQANGRTPRRRDSDRVVRVVIVDDSVVTREYLRGLFEADDRFIVSGTATDGADALELLARQRPDVVLMDVKMPVMDGFEATRRIMSTDPVPIVILSASQGTDEVELSMRAIEAGALAAFHKPPGPHHPDQPRAVRQLKATVRALSEVKLVTRIRSSQPGGPAAPAPRPVPRWLPGVVAIGASTGGPVAVQEALASVPPEFPLPILLVQHICPGFIEGFAAWLNGSIRLPVRMAVDGELLAPGTVYVGPDNHHLTVSRAERIGLVQPAAPGGHCPAVGELFRSVTAAYAPDCTGVLMTGMGTDGAAELKEMRQAGGTTIVQNQASCVVFGMPGTALNLDAAMHVLTPAEIGVHLVHLARQVAEHHVLPRA